MNPFALAMMIVGCSVVWGGLLLCVGIALTKKPENK
ncbi:MetS family NSS transporter small subunit [Lacrimispora sp.]|nr:MetS family NSS transporter small subunit [Lacrimispora sp.]